MTLEPDFPSAPWARHCGVEPRRLHEALVTLSSDDASVSARDSAARQLLQQLSSLAPFCLSRYLPTAARRYGAGPPVSVLDDAIQHVAIVATTGRARFRGTHPSEAVAWCWSVLSNQVRSELRWQSRHQNIEPFAFPPELIQAAPTEAAMAVRRLRQDLLKYLRQTRTPRAAHSLFRAACCFLDHLMGAPLDRQIARWAGGRARQDLEPSQVRRARNRIYQYHRRGRLVLNELLEPARVHRVDESAGAGRARVERSAPMVLDPPVERAPEFVRIGGRSQEHGRRRRFQPSAP